MRWIAVALVLLIGCAEEPSVSPVPVAPVVSDTLRIENPDLPNGYVERQWVCIIKLGDRAHMFHVWQRAVSVYDVEIRKWYELPTVVKGDGADVWIQWRHGVARLTFYGRANNMLGLVRIENGTTYYEPVTWSPF